MKKLISIIVLAAAPMAFSPASAQTKPASKTAVSRADNCAPIGRTANGELVYSMKCANLPGPPTPPPQASVEEAAPPPPPPQAQRGGIFGWSYDRRPD